ncbi:hypothetical protein ACV50R_003266 [Salmonella enterica subsp. enterica serovar Newport]|nr:hypothetical protein [Salmonella enterica subsp. salamae serovar Sofia]ECJ2322890.1 hypothetical protein [Salmonella enterica subsp. salamae serovar Sofia]HAK7538770.1 hypothetical protein [Salmonella enterica]
MLDAKAVFPAPTIGNGSVGTSFDKHAYKFVKIIAPGDQLTEGQQVIFYFKRSGKTVFSSERIDVTANAKQIVYKCSTAIIPDGTFDISYSVIDEGTNIGSSLELKESFENKDFQGIPYSISENCFLKQWGGFNFYNADPSYRELAASAGAFAIRSEKTRSLLVAGDVNYGGVVPDNIDRIIDSYDIVNTYSTQDALGAVITLDDGTSRFMAWGNNIPNDYKFAELMSDVKAVYSNQYSFIVLHNNLVKNKYWLTGIGRSDCGALIPDEIHLALVNDKPSAVYATYNAYSVLTESGKIYSWGNANFGGVIPPQVKDFLNRRKMEYICATSQAFCAYNTDGDIITWGDSNHGGSIDSQTLDDIADDGGVYTVVASNGAFCAITQGRKKAVAWGNRSYGGLISGDALSVAARGKIVLCRASNTSFAIISKAGDIGCWGAINKAPLTETFALTGDSVTDSRTGSSDVILNKSVVLGIKNYMKSLEWVDEEPINASGKSRLKSHVKKATPPVSMTSVKTATGSELDLYSNDGAFFLIARDEGYNTEFVTAWGNTAGGGVLNGDISETLSAAKVLQVVSTNGAFGCLVDAGKTKGIVVVWGRSLQQSDAGSLPTDPEIKSLLNRDVVALYSLKMLPGSIYQPPRYVDPAIAAVLKDGTYVVWGGRIKGGAQHLIG